MFRFEYFFLLYFVLLLPPLVWLLYRLRNRPLEKFNKLVGDRLATNLLQSFWLKRRKIKYLLSFWVLFFLLLAGARPQFGKGVKKITSSGIELLVLFDVSESMLTEDQQPSRLEFAKSELGRFLDMATGHKIGLVAFAGSSALVSPITTDMSALKLFVDSLTIDSVSRQGTRIGEALLVAEEAFKRGTSGDAETTKSTKAILILSDGENHEADAVKKAQELGKDGIKIFSIAFGTEKGGPIPERNERGYLTGYRKDASGQVITSTSRGDILKSLAQESGGFFARAIYGGEQMKQILAALNQLEKQEFASSLSVDYEDNFQIFVFLALALAIFEFWLGERKPDFQLWRGRFEVPPR